MAERREVESALEHPLDLPILKEELEVGGAIGMESFRCKRMLLPLGYAEKLGAIISELDH